MPFPEENALGVCSSGLPFLRLVQGEKSKRESKNLGDPDIIPTELFKINLQDDLPVFGNEPEGDSLKGTQLGDGFFGGGSIPHSLPIEPIAS